MGPHEISNKDGWWRRKDFRKNSVLSSFPMFKYLKVSLRSLTIVDQDYSGNVMSIKRSINLLGGVFFTNPKVFGGGGLGIFDLDIQNMCLLSKWSFKVVKEEGLWQNILKKKYLKYKTFTQVVVNKRGDSLFWSGIKEIKGLVEEAGLKFKMVPRLDSGRISGLVMNH
jgi:hypothetical protein